MVATVEHADAVGAYQGSTILSAGVEDALFEQGSLRCLLAEAGGDDDEGARLLFAGQQLHIVGTEACRHHEDSQVGGRQFLHVVADTDALHLILLGVDYSQLALIATAYQVAYDGSSGLVHIVGAADDNDALRF